MAKHRSYSVEFKRQVVQDYLASETLDWVEEDFDPNIVDADELAEAVMALARRWSRNAPYHPTNLVFDRHFFSGYQRDRLITAVYLGV